MITVRPIKPIFAQTVDIDFLTADQYENGMQMYNEGALIQVAFPDLTASQRELILTGATDEIWNETFPDEDE
jgi:ribosome recycling factor